MSKTKINSKTRIDWKAAEAVAQQLGLHTRQLVTTRDADAVRERALWAARDHDVGSHNVPRASSYFELAVLVGHSEPTEAKEADDAD
jgi:hypothetical protein